MVEAAAPGGGEGHGEGFVGFVCVAFADDVLEDKLEASHQAVELVHFPEGDPEAFLEEVGEFVGAPAGAAHAVDAVVEAVEVVVEGWEEGRKRREKSQ